MDNSVSGAADKNLMLMKTGSIPKLLLKYSCVTFIALFFNELYNIIDTLFVSHGVGDNAMGGVSIIFPFMLIQGAVSQTIGAGAASLVSKALGENQYEKAGNITQNAMCAFYGTAVVITAAGLLFIDPLLKLFGATPDIYPYAKEYFIIILIGNVFSTGFSSIIRAEGKMVYGLLIWLIPTAVNVLLDGVFIYGLHIGVRGAALATVISYFVSFLMSVLFFAKLSVQKFRRTPIKWKTIYEIVTLGVPMLLQMGGMSLLFLILNKAFAEAGGTLYVNMFAYVSKIITFALVLFSAVASVASPVIGFNYGAGERLRVKKTYNTALLICEIYSVFAVIITLCFSDKMIAVFTVDQSIIELGKNILCILSPAMFFVPIVLITGSYFQAVGKKLPATAVNGIMIVFAFLFILVFGKLFSVNGIYISIIASCVLSAVVSIVLKKCIKINKI